ncbi:hypothetical protein SAMN04487991_1107 [Celeribacter neptunius]|uniref:Uncharacterized protein n=1 Tax=Celeribacter neptunius TaxID=588602 RepID=A0A1I3LPU2_9RHOB|nr:hypothetical protein SAMN04487991_1107 [Celeribacter neptunius]
MMHIISSDLIRAYAEFSADGHPINRERANLRAFRQARRAERSAARAAKRSMPLWRHLASGFLRRAAPSASPPKRA